MSVRSRLRVETLIVVALTGFFWGGSSIPQSFARVIDLGDQNSIVEAALTAPSPEEAKLSSRLAKQAGERGNLDQQRLGHTDWGPLSKLWCEAVLFAPRPENLVECARATFGAASQASNPQPSVSAANAERARQSLVMIRAALEIAGGDPDVSATLRARLMKDADCLRRLIASRASSNACTPPYGE